MTENRQSGIGLHSRSLTFAELEVRRARLLRAHRAIAHLNAMREAGIPPAVRLAHFPRGTIRGRLPLRAQQAAFRNSKPVRLGPRMIVTVTRVVIVGGYRIEQTATAQIDRSMTESIHEALAVPGSASARQTKITQTATALFESINSQPATRDLTI